MSHAIPSFQLISHLLTTFAAKESRDFVTLTFNLLTLNFVTYHVSRSTSPPILNVWFTQCHVRLRGIRDAVKITLELVFKHLGNVGQNRLI